MRILTAVCLVLASLCLYACGSGGGDDGRNDPAGGSRWDRMEWDRGNWG